MNLDIKSILDIYQCYFLIVITISHKAQNFGTRSFFFGVCFSSTSQFPSHTLVYAYEYCECVSVESEAGERNQVNTIVIQVFPML